MRTLLRLVAAGMLLVVLPSAAQQKKESLPKVWSASAPLYPPLPSRPASREWLRFALPPMANGL